MMYYVTAGENSKAKLDIPLAGTLCRYSRDLTISKKDVIADNNLFRILDEKTALVGLSR